ncbi:MAG: response regulator [Deinococcales bacterium]
MLASQTNTASNNHLVLVVEDEFNLAQTIELYLRKEGYRTERAGDGRKALELFRLARPDLVILDIGLPELDGLEVLKQSGHSIIPR